MLQSIVSKVYDESGNTHTVTSYVGDIGSGIYAIHMSSIHSWHRNGLLLMENNDDYLHRLGAVDDNVKKIASHFKFKFEAINSKKPIQLLCSYPDTPEVAGKIPCRCTKFILDRLVSTRKEFKRIARTKAHSAHHREKDFNYDFIEYCDETHRL